MVVKIVNESAMGTYVLAWQGSNGRNRVVWYKDLPAPVFSFYVTSLGRMSPPIPARHPERFGWTGDRGSHAKNMDALKAFVQALAAALGDGVPEMSDRDGPGRV
jgi:hypothetical protein